jgi:hypothetical protein
LIAIFMLALATGRTAAQTSVASGTLPTVEATTAGVAPAAISPLSSRIDSPAAPTGPWVRPSISVTRCADSPRIDGKLDDACWNAAAHVGGFYRLTGNAAIPEQTEAWICSDKDHLYVAFHCLDGHPEMIRESQTQRGGRVVDDDYVEVAVDSQNAHRNSSLFWVTARGTQRESLEGGTADNITWAGDWMAATARTGDGWTAEVSIPFALLRYPKGATTFSLGLFRKLARETTTQCWPYFPQSSDQGSAEYLAVAAGINPPYYAPHPIFLPYVLASAGEGDSDVQTGLDIKYPLTTTMTSLATIHPDFRTIEQDVTNINFSYNEQFIRDRRPFFAEGRGFFPADDIFYSPRIPKIDGGLKLYGKQGNTVLGFLGTSTHGAQGQTDAVFRIRQEFGLLSAFAISGSYNDQAGKAPNETVKFVGDYGVRKGSEYYALNVTHIPSWVGGRQKDAKQSASITWSGKPGHPYVNVEHLDIGPNFINNIGFIPEKNVRGNSLVIDQWNQFDKGRVESYEVGVSASHYDHHTGGFFHEGVSGWASVADRSGFQLGVNLDQSRRDEFHDHTAGLDVSWNRKTLFQRGGASVTIGKVAGQDYRFTSLSQGILITKALSMQLNHNDLHLGDFTSTQSVVTGTYLLSPTQTIGGRLVQEDGATNVYFSFGQHVRSGNDVYVLFGDPNADKTKNIVTVKVIRPL